MDHKNPVIIGIVGATLALAYFYLQEQHNKSDDDKSKKERRIKTLFIIPVAVGIIIWFLSSCYFDMSYDVCAEITSPKNNYVLRRDGGAVVPLLGGDRSFKSPITTDIIGRNNIRLPSTDVFIDLARF